MKRFTKKILATVLALSLLAGFSASVISFAGIPGLFESTKNKITYVYKLNDDGTATIIDMNPENFCSPEINQIHVPEIIDGHTVTAFGCVDGFMRTALNTKFPNLTDIYFPETITTLKPNAFWSYNSLTFHFNDHLVLNNFQLIWPQPCGPFEDNTFAAFMAVSEYFIVEYKGFFYKIDVPKCF